MKILTVVGARPQFIKAAPVSRLLRPRHDEVLVHTGQHYDDTMSSAIFRDLELREPDRNLEVGSGSHGWVTAEIIRRLEPLIDEHRPHVVLLYGDTNSTLAGAVVAAKARGSDGRAPALVHVEAGLRSFNREMPEEHNRVVADHLADLLLAPTPAAMANLAREGLAERARLVGDVMVDVFHWAAARADAALPPVAASAGSYVLLTLHRAETVDDPGRLTPLLTALRIEVPVIFPVHPRTLARIRGTGVRLPANVTVIEPVGYLAMVALERRAWVIATDSGGVQKEAYLAGVPCVTLRDETEWVETVEAGWNVLAGRRGEGLAAALRDNRFLDRDRARPALFGDGHAAERAVAELEAYAA